MATFPRIKGRELLAILQAEPLAYQVVRQKGSHRTLKAEGRPTLGVSYSEGADVPGGVLREYLVKRIGLSEDEALRLVEDR